MSSVAVLANDRYARMPGLTGHPPVFAAYREFDEGMNRLLDQRYAEADSSFRRAFALDSAFVVALVYDMAAAWNIDDMTQVEAALREIRKLEPVLSDFDRLWLEYYAALLAGNGPAAYDAIVRANELAPGGRASYSAAHTALTIDKPSEAVRLLRAADPDRGDMRGWKGDLAFYRARLAAVRGDDELARTLLGDAVRAGVSGLAWVHASAWRDLEPLANSGVSIPASFTVESRSESRVALP